MQYDYLDEFLAVTREGTLSAAASKLGVSQPSLGRHLSSLEAELGVRLLDRGPQGVRLTTAGEIALPVADAIHALEESLVEHFKDPERRVRERVLAIGCSYLDEYMYRLMDKVCDRLKDEGYAVRLEVSKLPADENVTRLLLNRDLDAVICLRGQTPDVQNDSCFETDLAPMHAGVVVQEGSPLISHGSLVLEDVIDNVFTLGHEPGQHALWDEFLRACDTRGLPAPAFRAQRRGSRCSESTRGYRGTPGAPETEDNQLFDGRDKTRSSASSVPTRSNDLYLTVCDPLHPVTYAPGQTVLPLADFAYDVVALVRADDGAARRISEVAREVSLGAGVPKPARQQNMYVALPKSDMCVGALSRAEQGQYLSQVLDEPEVPQDLVLPDGTVVDKVYVALRNRLNRIGDGLSGDPVNTSFEAIMHLWSPEEAQAYLEMPMLEYFTAYDYAVDSGRGLAQCERICEDLAKRNLICRVMRGGVPHYFLLAWTYGIWEFMIKSYEKGFLDWGIYGYDLGSASRFPTMRVCPVGPEAVRGGHLSPYWDWRSLIERQELICMAPCQCQVSNEVEAGVAPVGPAEQKGLCLTFGDMAQYWLENGNGIEISKQECLDRAHAAVFESSCIPQVIYSKNPEVMCFCDAMYCHVLAGVKSTCGAAPSMPLASAYRLTCDMDACLHCGTCVRVCPMHAVTMGRDGVPDVGPTCAHCGQCVLACSAGARILVEKDHGPEARLPEDLLEDYRWRSEDRMARGYISDFTKPTIDVWAGM